MTSPLGPHLAADGTLVPAPMSRRVMNLADLLHGTARRLPDRPGLVWRGETWSWKALGDRVTAAAAALAARGIAKGDRVLCQARNGNAMFEAMFAVWTLGAVWVPTNFRNTPQEVAYIARASRARAMICESVFPDHAAAVKAEDADLALTVSIGAAPFADTDWEALVAEGSALGPSAPRRSSMTIPAGSSSPPARPAGRRRRCSPTARWASW